MPKPMFVRNDSILIDKVDNFSVLMPCHRMSKSLYEAINSVIFDVPKTCKIYLIVHRNMALYRKLETDFTQKQVVIIADNVSVNLAGVLNYGLSLINSKYVFRMDSDDIWLEGRYKSQGNFALQNPTIDVIAGSFEVINSNGKHCYFIKRTFNDLEIKNLLVGKCILAHPTILAKTNSIIEAGGYNVHFDAADDFELWSRMRNKYKFASIPELLIKYRLHHDSISFQKSLVQLNETLHILLRNNLSTYGLNYLACRKSSDKIGSHFNCKIGVLILRLKRKYFIYRLGLELYDKSLFKNSFDSIISNKLIES
jgi:glycosyltransferase involved in cell wall biosynthesis